MIQLSNAEYAALVAERDSLLVIKTELIEALEKVVATLPHIGGNERSVQGLLTIANEAIAKARGEA